MAAIGSVASACADAAGLPAAGVVELDVELALDARVDVPGGFAVAHGDDAGGFHRRIVWSGSRRVPSLRNVSG